MAELLLLVRQRVELLLVETHGARSILALRVVLMPSAQHHLDLDRDHDPVLWLLTVSRKQCPSAHLLPLQVRHELVMVVAHDFFRTLQPLRLRPNLPAGRKWEQASGNRSLLAFLVLDAPRRRFRDLFPFLGLGLRLGGVCLVGVLTGGSDIRHLGACTGRHQPPRRDVARHEAWFVTKLTL